MSDVVGRKPVVIGCLLGTVMSHIMVARSTTLAGVAWGRVVGGVTGGLTPIAQAAVADVVSMLPDAVSPDGASTHGSRTFASCCCLLQSSGVLFSSFFFLCLRKALFWSASDRRH